MLVCRIWERKNSKARPISIIFFLMHSHVITLDPHRSEFGSILISIYMVYILHFLWHCPVVTTSCFQLELPSPLDLVLSQLFTSTFNTEGKTPCISLWILQDGMFLMKISWIFIRVHIQDVSSAILLPISIIITHICKYLLNRFTCAYSLVVSMLSFNA